MGFLLTGSQTAELREKIMDECVIPVVRALFDQYPQLRSAVMLVAQYWNDHARDAVHHKVFFSVLETPDLDSLFTYQDLECNILYGDRSLR